VTRNGQDVAVKKLKLCDTNLNDKQFQTELNNLRKLEHQNIVQILGYCYEIERIPFDIPDRSKVYLEKTHRALCFEYLDNGSLQKHLSGMQNLHFQYVRKIFVMCVCIIFLFTTADELNGLDWHTRFKIIKGTCEGLNYIHEELEAPIYHLDLKPDNILLAKDMVPKIADFGLSRIFDKEPKRTTPNPYGTQ
jgi:serine/threonine protein kinase